MRGPEQRPLQRMNLPETRVGLVHLDVDAFRSELLDEASPGPKVRESLGHG